MVDRYFYTMEERTIIEEWNQVPPPPPPALTHITVDPKVTAMLILDIQPQNCSERRPRCVKQIPKIRELLKAARNAKMPIIYSVIRSAQGKDIREEVKPQEGEPILKGGVDKFYKTELEDILKQKSIETVIIVGTSAHGAVLHTATGAAAREFNVIVPVDGMSATDAFCEQYTAWHIANSPGTRRHATITRIDWVTIQH
jgi:nicotinamidase-related amidase